MSRNEHINDGVFDWSSGIENTELLMSVLHETAAALAEAAQIDTQKALEDASSYVTGN